MVIVNNEGNCELDKLDLSAFRAEILKSPRAMGFAEANNFALVQTESLGEYVVFLNQDTQTRDSWLDACIQCLHADERIAAVTPMTKTYDWQSWDPYYLECARKSETFALDFDKGNELAQFYETPVIPAAAMVVRRNVLEAVGPFDPVFGSYYEDYDLCRRIQAAGYKVGICTKGTIAHFSSSATTTPAAERRRARWITRNRVIFGQRVTDQNRLVSLLKHFFFVFPRGMARSLLRRPTSKPLLPYILAHLDLLRLSPRLVSEKRDQSCWSHYLKEINWPTSTNRKKRWR